MKGGLIVKIKKQLALCIVLWLLCTAFSACGNAELTLPQDTSALESYIAETSAKAYAPVQNTESSFAESGTTVGIAEKTAAVENVLVFSDFDRAVNCAENVVSGGGKFLLYDLDFDGIPELLQETGFMDTMGWEVYKLTGDEALNIGCIKYRNTQYNSINGLALGDGVHIYRDTEKDEIFYISEYSTELHTMGCYKCIRYDIYLDRLAETPVSECEFYTYDDCGESGNRYIYYNAIAGRKASPKFRVDSNAEGFRFCNELEEYLSRFEYLGTINDTNAFNTKDGGDFSEYAEQFRDLPKVKSEQVYIDNNNYITVCGTKYCDDVFGVTIEINEENHDTIDLSELKRLPRLSVLEIVNRTDHEVDLAPLAEFENLTTLRFHCIFSNGSFKTEALKDFDWLEDLSGDVPIEYLPEMESLRYIEVYPDSDDPDGYAPLYDMKQLEAVSYYCVQQENGQIETLREHRPDLLCIYVP